MNAYRYLRHVHSTWTAGFFLPYLLRTWREDRARLAAVDAFVNAAVPTERAIRKARRAAARAAKKGHQGVTAKSVPLAELMPAEGVLRDDVHEDIADLEIEADRTRAEAAERGNDTRDDVLGGIDPEIHAANEPIFVQLLAEFDASLKAIVDRFVNEPQAPRRVLAAAELTQEIDKSAIRELVAA